MIVAFTTLGTFYFLKEKHKRI